MTQISDSRHYCIASRSARTAFLLRKFIEERMQQSGIEDIVPAHGDVLVVLFEHGCVTMSELARHSARTKATTTVLVDKLVKCGYAERCSNSADARSCLIKLTAKGRALKPVFENISSAMDAIFVDALGKEKAQELQDALAELINSLDR